MEPFDNLEVGGSLPFAFFCVFSRYEFALKEAGFLTSIEAETNAKADWTCFSKRIQAGYSQSQEQDFVEAANYLLDKPPERQYVKSDGSLGFKKPTETRRDIDWLLTLICRVRNNLFHGGKFSGRDFYSERDEILTRSSLIVLNSCLDWNEQVKKHYLGYES